nr:GM03761p [Drosophila melanogaster]
MIVIPNFPMFRLTKTKKKRNQTKRTQNISKRNPNESSTQNTATNHPKANIQKRSQAARLCLVQASRKRLTDCPADPVTDTTGDRGSLVRTTPVEPLYPSTIHRHPNKAINQAIKQPSDQRSSNRAIRHAKPHQQC